MSIKPLKALTAYSLSKTSMKAIKKRLHHGQEVRPIENAWQKAKTIALRFYKALDTPIALSCYLLLKNDDITGLINLSVNPLNYEDMTKFADDYAAVSFLKKYEGFPLKLRQNTKAAAIKSTVHCEYLCDKTNKRLRNCDFSQSQLDVLIKASNLISSVLQSCPTVKDILQKDGIPSFGPGVSSSCKGQYTSVYNKLDSDLHVTAAAVPYAKSLLDLCPRLIPSYPESSKEDLDVEGHFSLPYDLLVIPGNSFTTVPKNAKTDRPICIEPHLNMVLQKMYGGVISKRLQRFGIDTRTQHFTNVKLAKSCSIDGQMATIDLSSASDTISTELVRNLLPDDWFNTLNNIRSQSTRYGDVNRVNSKFSSMGNGFTFELETLLFWAISAACLETLDVPRRGNLSVFGDDIVIHIEAVELLVDTLESCGFVINKDKSFSTGYFRESCGSDYWAGFNIRPYFLKKEITNAQNLIEIANGIRHYASRRMCGLFSDLRFKGVWHCVLDDLTLNEQSIGPSSLGDTVIWAQLNELRDAVVPTHIDGICYAVCVLDKGYRIRRHNRFITGALMTSRSPVMELGRHFSVDDGSPMSRKHRGNSLTRKVTRVAVPVGIDALSWL